MTHFVIVFVFVFFSIFYFRLNWFASYCGCLVSESDWVWYETSCQNSKQNGFSVEKRQISLSIPIYEVKCSTRTIYKPVIKLMASSCDFFYFCFQCMYNCVVFMQLTCKWNETKQKNKYRLEKGNFTNEFESKFVFFFSFSVLDHIHYAVHQQNTWWIVNRNKTKRIHLNDFDIIMNLTIWRSNWTPGTNFMQTATLSKKVDSATTKHLSIKFLFSNKL